ncbi:MAG: four helix bundle protein [Ignavibacteriales bacterium]|nr:four helix bundle protein [Ignavibacteriales bacterium]
MVNPKPHKKLVLWEKALTLVVLIYSITKRFPREEEFGLKSQLRRAAVSVPSNIAEGLTRRTNGDKVHFLNIAQGSLSEIDAQLEISFRLNFIDERICNNAINALIEVEKLLSGLIRSLKT